MTPQQGAHSGQSQLKSPHLEDEFLEPFLDSTFDAVDYLNKLLPPLASTLTGSMPTRLEPQLLPDLVSDHVQPLVSQLNVHNTRLLDVLTELTDDVMRSGSRLEYQVEILRGETISAYEVLRNRLDAEQSVLQSSSTQAEANTGTGAGGGSFSATPEPRAPVDADRSVSAEPACMEQLRMLAKVRSRLDAVIKVFGEAMEFTFPPSELSTTSSFLSLSTPDPGDGKQTTEDKGKQVLAKLRQEIVDLLSSKEDPIDGIEKAAQRVEELKELSTVWKGTIEEKGRAKFIESLAKMVEDQHRDLLREINKKKTETVSTSSRQGVAAEVRAQAQGLGLLSKLQKMRVGL